MRTRQQESPAILQQQRQNVRAAEHRNPCLAGADELRVILRNRGEGGDDHCRQLPQQAQVFLRVSDLNLCAGRAQRHDAARLLHVRPADLVAAVQQDAGDTGHAGAADAHHVHAGEVRGLRLLAHRGRSCLSKRREDKRIWYGGYASAAAMILSAIFSAASLWPAASVARLAACQRVSSRSNGMTSWETR